MAIKSKVEDYYNQALEIMKNVVDIAEQIDKESENENVDINIVNYSKITIEWKPTNPSNIKMYSIVLGDFKFEK